jgi:curved DNA-binding protein CbpA
MAMDNDAAREVIRSWIAQQRETLERGSYYTLLGVPRHATDDEVRTAYYQLVARFHPDLYGDTLLDAETRGRLVTLYSRLVEAYRVLSDGHKRGIYDKGLDKGRLRYTQDDERAPMRDPEAEISNPNARRFYKMGKAAMLQGDGRNAVMNLKFALSADPTNDLIRSELAQAEAMVKGKR